MRRASIRVRVVAAATAVAAVGLAAAAFALVGLAERSLLAGARADAEDVVAGLSAEFEPGAALAVEAVPGAQYVVRDAAGQVVAASWVADVPGGAAVVVEPIPGAPELEPASPDWASAVSVVAVDGASYTISAAVPLDAIRQSLRTLRALLGAGVPLLVGAIALLTWWLTGRALAPVADLTLRADRIADPAGGERLPVPAGNDEVADLATTLNGMLDRLAASSARARRFVSDASHELRSPVATIRAVVEAALRSPDGADWERVGADVLAEDARLERLVADLLTLARLDEAPAPDHRAVDLGAVVAEEAGRERRVPVHADLEPAVVEGNAERLAQLAGHLLDNAARHAASRVDVTVRAGPPVALVVADDGAGVPAGDRDRIFDRFARLDEGRSRDAGGFGLGLAVVRAVADEHGGSVGVGPAQGGGARFEVQLPAAGASAGSLPAHALELRSRR